MNRRDLLRLGAGLPFARVFGEHPDWFVKDAAGAPLRSDTVTFGGWRRGPWYVLDGTHPDAQAHLTRVFETMRRECGCSWFKLDANVWGAIHGARPSCSGAITRTPEPRSR